MHFMQYSITELVSSAIPGMRNMMILWLENSHSFYNSDNIDMNFIQGLDVA